MSHCGQVEVDGVHGPIDIVSQEQVVEVKHAPMYTRALGHVLGHVMSFPDRDMRIHLFGTREELIEYQPNAEELCGMFGVILTAEEVEM